MKKCDLHIHTIPTISDENFLFCMETLDDYITKMQIDVIGITNHNVFNLCQFNDINTRIGNKIVVLPGVEVNLENGHILVIANNTPSELEDFNEKCQQVSNLIKNATDQLSVDQFKSIFSPLSKYLLVPHYEKDPKLSRQIINELSENIFAGEVTSVKKFLYMLKNEEERLTPLLFSDFRPQSSSVQYPTRQTYFEVDEVNIQTLRGCLMDKLKVKLTPVGNERFSVLDDGLLLSTKLNIMLGKRSSGKTYTLNRIAEAYNGRAKYIRQFELLDNTPGADQFNTQIKVAQEAYVKLFLKEFEEVVQDILQVPSQEQDENDIEKFVISLKECAEESATKDVYSHSIIYNESKFIIPSEQEIQQVIEATIVLLENKNYQDIIGKYITLEQLISLLQELFTKYDEIVLQKKKKEEANIIIDEIKSVLHLKSSSPSISNIDFYTIALHYHKRKLFEEIASGIKREYIIHKEKVGNFTIEISTHPYINATDMKYGRKIALADAFNKYEIGSSYSFLEALKEVGVESDKIHTLFTKVEYKILNSSGLPVSGGERSEFNFMQKIKDSQLCDILIIDEPESSFDNIFLNQEINSFLKEMSQQMPVVISTHNSTIGASIKPDYILYTEKFINAQNEPEFRIYGGSPSAKTLRTISGEEIPNYTITMDSLEAGKIAYAERKRMYETLDN